MFPYKETNAVAAKKDGGEIFVVGDALRHMRGKRSAFVN